MTSFPTIDALIICPSPQIPGIHLSESFNTIKMLLTASLHPLPIHYRLTMHILHPIQSCLTCHFQPNKWSAGFHIYEEEKILNYQWHVVCVLAFSKAARLHFKKCLKFAASCCFCEKSKHSFLRIQRTNRQHLLHLFNVPYSLDSSNIVFWGMAVRGTESKEKTNIPIPVICPLSQTKSKN